MTAKHIDKDDDDALPAPKCFVPIEEHEKEVRAAEHRSKRIGELNGPWALLLKGTLIFTPLFASAVLGWGVWVTQRIAALEKDSAVLAKIVEQIKDNTITLGRHDRELTSNAQAIIALTKELGTAEQRLTMYVSRHEWNLRNETRDREMDENRVAHAEIASKLDRLIERIGERPRG